MLCGVEPAACVGGMSCEEDGGFGAESDGVDFALLAILHAHVVCE